jgi:hypothetical protein
MKSRLLKLKAVAGAVAALLCAGCASNQQEAPPPKPGSSIHEHYQIADEAHAAIQAAMSALDEVRGVSTNVPARSLENLSATINRLQVDSTRLRARAQTIHQRGDAWFENWRENLAEIQDPALRARIEAKHLDLRRSFEKIKTLSQEARTNFQPFLQGLRQIRNALEAGPSSASEDRLSQAIETSGKHGVEVERCIGGVKAELESMRQMLGLDPFEERSGR